MPDWQYLEQKSETNIHTPANEIQKTHSLRSPSFLHIRHRRHRVPPIHKAPHPEIRRRPRRLLMMIPSSVPRVFNAAQNLTTAHSRFVSKKRISRQRCVLPSVVLGIDGVLKYVGVHGLAHGAEVG